MRPALHLALLLVQLLHSARSDPDNFQSLVSVDPIVKPKRDYRDTADAHDPDTDPIPIPKRNRRAGYPRAQVPGVLVPQPVQLVGPDGGQLVQPFSQMIYSYMVNPFESYINQIGQTPVQYQHQKPVPQVFNPSQRVQVNQPFYQPYSQPAVQQPQFFQAPGQQPFVYHPNYVQQPQYQYQQYLNPSHLPQQQFGRPSFALLYGAPQQDAGFDRGHIEAHPLQLHVDPPTRFRQAQEERDPGLISRGAVESIPITAQVYSGHRDDGFVETRFEDSGSFSRGDVESYPAILKPLPYTTDDYQESIIREGDGYGSYGLAGFRQSVESPPIFTAQNDPAEAYPMTVKANSRPFGQVSESFLFDDRPQSYVPRPDFYSYSNPRVEQTSSQSGYKIVCYYESWAVYRPQPLDFSVSDIDPFACTHLLYSFAGLEETNYTIVSLDPDYDIVTGGYKAVVSLKGQNPELKVMIAIGGWNEGGRKYSRMVSSKEYRNKFVKSVVSFLEEHHFDGLDLDWEYPAASDRGGRFSDKENFVSLVRELAEEFKPRGWLLSAAVSPARFRVNEGYDVPTLGMYLDFINVMTYDLRGPWDGKADHHSPIASKNSDSWAYKTLNVKDGMQYWAEKGAPRNKLVLGVPFYGRTFTLTQGNEAEPGARASSGGFEGRYTKERGLFAYYEVCQEQRNGGWIKRQDEVGGPYMVKKDQWVGYDDSVYITKKMDLVRSEGYGGAMIWAIDLDDYLGLCGSRWPLLSAIRSSLADGSPPVPQQANILQEIESKPEPAPEPEAEPTPEPEAEPAPTTDSTRDTPSPTPPVSASTEASVPPGVMSMTCSTQGAYMHDESDCSSYYMCVHGEYQRFTCQTPLQWNRNKNVCDWKKNAQCTSIGGATPPSGASAPVGDSATLPTTTQRPIPSVELEPVASQGGLSGDYMVVCYFTNWAWYRPGIGKYKPDDIDPTICTHIVYGFAVLDYSNLVIKPHDSWADLDNKFYEKVTALRRLGIKVTLAIGGWNDSAGDKYSRLVNDPAARRKFIDHVIPFIEKYGFDGLDLDWEYPRCWQVDCNKGPASDKQAFADWIRELSDAFKPKGLLLSAAVSPSKKVIDEGYDVPALNRYLDWIAVMTYDYHGQWDKKTGHVAPSYNHPDDDIDYFNMDFTIRYWLEKGASKNKIVLGMPMYGQSFTLNNADVNGLNAPARSGGTAGEFTRAKGFLAYYEICDRVRNKGWTVVKDPENRMGPYAYSDNQWVSYDDVDTIRRKSQYIRDLGLAGGMIWALDLDDFRNRCGQGAHPLMNTIKSVLGPSRSGGPVQRPTDTIPSPPTPPQTTRVEVTTASSVTSTPIVPPPAPPSSDEYKVVCYFTNWAWYRQGEGKYKPEDIDPSLCTHIIYGFAVLDNSRLLIKPHDTWADFDNKFYEQVTSHKQRGVKVLVAIGGWNDSLGPKYSKLVNDPQARRRFTEHVIEFILKHNFDGLDLDWEYPVCWQVDCKKGPASDKDAFSAWIMELSAAFKPHGLLLSAAVSPSNKVMDLGYDIPVLSRYLDWIAVMTYDYHGQWDKKTGHVAPMFAHPEDENRFFNTNYTISYWIQGGADRKKIVMGMPMYGQSFTLSQASDNTLNKPSYGGGEAGPYTRARGFLAYYEICYFIKNQDWTVVRDPFGTMGPYAYRGNQWVGFDDVGVIQYKSEYIKRMGLGGGMIWALDLDDFRNRCGCEEHPLLRTINRVLRGYSIPDPGCPVLGGGSPSSLQPFGSRPHDAVPTTTTTTTVPPWMTQWTPAPTTSRTTTKSPWEPPVSTTRAPWLPPSATTEAPWQLPPDTTDRTTSKATTKPAETGEACEVGEYKAHESDCAMFYQCNQGKFEERKCFPGLHWAKTRCDWPKNANCGSAPSIVTPVPLPPGVPSIPPMVVTSTFAPPSAQITTAVAIPSTRPPSPIIAPDPSGFKVVCYFTNWAWYRQGAGKYKPEDIDPSLCTHIVYGFAVLDGSRLLIKPHDTWADYDNKFYEKVTGLKKNGVKVLIAIGGWNDSAGGKYSKLVNSPEARRRFTEHVLEFVLKHNFDGLDLDWEYPKCWQVECDKGPESDKPAFSAWIQELYEAFQPHGLLLSAAVSPSYKVIDAGYEVPALNRYLDWIAVMTYDYHGHWDKKTGHVAPMFHYPESEVPEFNANYTIHYWLQHGADRKKLVMGMPMYGQSFSLASGEDNGYNAKSYGRGEAGEFTRAGGFLAYYEICDRILNQGYTVVRDPQGSIGPYAYKGGQWFGFDDISMIRYKSEYIKQMGLGGGMIWALDLDDFRNRCGCEEHPLLRTINRVLRGYSIPDPGCTI